MKLTTEGRIASANVTEEELLNAFQDDTGRSEFIILTQSDQVFIQATGDYPGAFMMEYREGDNTHHFQCTQSVLKENVQSVFMKYLKEDNSWKTDFEWKQLEKPWWRFW